MKQMADIDERAEMLAAIRELADNAGERWPRSCDILTEEVLAQWPTKTMRSMLARLKPDDLSEIIGAARVLAARAFEILEARWKADKDLSGKVLREILEPVVVAIVNVWLSSEDSRKMMIRVKRKIVTGRRSRKK